MDLGEPPEEYLEFRRMMNSAGREDLRRMVERLTERIRSDPGDTESLFLRGLVYRGPGRAGAGPGRLRRRRRAGTGLRPGPPRPGDHQPQPGRVRPRPPGLRCRARAGPGQTPPALRGRGVALGGLDRHDEAMRDLDRSLALDPDNAETLTARGLTHTSLGRHELAIGDYTRVLDLGPRQHRRPLQPGDRQHAPGTVRAGRRGLQRRHRDRTRPRRIPGAGIRPRVAGGARRGAQGLRPGHRAYAGRPGGVPRERMRSCRAGGNSAGRWRTSGGPSPWTRRTWSPGASGRMLYRDLGEPERAVRDYDEIIRLDPDDQSVREERELAVKEAEGDGG